MSRRTTVGALLLTLLFLLAPPAAAKGPTEVKVDDPKTGATTLLDFADRGEMEALQLVVGWPQRTGEPRAVRRSELVHVATLTWQYGEGMVAWIDRVYTDDAGVAWVKRRDYLSGSGSVVWGRTSAYAIEAVLSEIQGGEVQPGEEGTTATMVTPPSASARAKAPQPSRGLHADSFAMGAGLTGLLAAGMALIVIRRGRRQLPGRVDGGAEPTRA